MPRLIGINGYRTSGKDTTFSIVRDILTPPGDEVVKRVAFADKLKLAAAKALGFEGTDAELIALMDEFKETGVIDASYGTDTSHGSHITGRQYLQNFGANARELFGDTFWIDQVLPNPNRGDGWLPQGGELLDLVYPGVEVVCVTDVRYQNEAERILALGGEVWEVIRPGLETDGHSSEQPLPFDLITKHIDNSGTIDDLAARVKEALNA